MTVTIKLEDLVYAFDWTSTGGGFGNTAYISLKTGETFHTSESGDVFDDIPEDIGDPALYLPVPDKAALDLGRELVLRFAEAELPKDYQAIRDIFRSRGAYARFKDLLDRRDKLEAWYAFETQATEQALRAWAEENGVGVVG